MNNQIPRDALARLKEQYPEGTRVVLVQMNDTQAPPPGTKGTVMAVDDIGTIHVKWDNGSSLGVAYGEDRCEVESRVLNDLAKRFDTEEGRAEFIRTAESGLYTGKTDAGLEVRVFLDKGEGMKVYREQPTKKEWWEVVYYDADGYQEGVSYEHR